MINNLSPLTCLVFKQHFHVKILDVERIALISEDTHYLLKGLLYVEFAKIVLTSNFSESEIKTKLSNQFSHSEIDYAISRLKNKGFISYSNLAMPIEQEAFWHDQGASFDQLDCLNSLKVSVKKFGNTNVTELSELLIKLGIGIVEDGDLDICVVDNYINEELEILSKQNFLIKKPWLLVKPTGSVIWIGPFFIAEKTGCWNCLSRYIKENRRVEVDIFGSNNSVLNIPSRSFIPTNQSIALNLAVNEILKWVVNKESILEKNILTIDSRSLSFHFHCFNSDLQCGECSHFAEEKKSFINLKSSPKKFISQDDERSCHPEETLEKLESIVSPITGIVSKIKYLKVHQTHIYYSVCNLPLPQNQIVSQKIRIPHVAVGKGSSKIHAKVACLAEAIERHNCTYYNQFQFRAKYEDLKNQALHPEKLLLISDYQYANRDVLNQANGPFNFIPKKFNRKETVYWTPFISLINHQISYVPSSYCYLNYPYPNELEMCPGDSNGCASGNTKEEAINYAILELIERDAFAIWWYNKISRPAINLDKLNDIHINNIRYFFEKSEREFYVLDITSDLGVPCFVAVSWQKNGKRIFLGSAANLNPYTAMLKAINELHQTMTRADISDSANFNDYPPTERDFIKWILQENIESQTFIKPYGMTSLKQEMQSHSMDFLDDINLYLKIFKNKNLDVLLLDMSQRNILFYSVKVIIPGLRHFWSRLAPGRLYDIPVSLGWLKSPKNEREMNFKPYFL